jgi:hypothetical protein
MLLLRNFFGTLASGLRATTESLITVLSSRKLATSNSIINVNLTMPPARIKSISYFIYVELYGPPQDTFEQTLIDKIEAQLSSGLTAEQIIANGP